MSAAPGRAACTILALLAVVSAMALNAPTANSAVATVTGGESGMLINVQTYFALGAKGIYTYTVPPATINGFTFTIYFPITGGLFDSPSMLGTINHGGGLNIVKYNADQTAVENSLETDNLRIVNGNTLTGDVSGLIPSPTADLVNTSVTQGPSGTVKYKADVNLTPATALVLNTYFNTDAFEAGMNLGYLTANIETQRYPRPGGGSPLRVPLVPSFAACASPNTHHVAPLDFDSCTPPQQESAQLTTSSVGTGSGSAKFTTIPGNPRTTEDEADVRIEATATDVSLKSNGSDYDRRVLLATKLRLTDRSGGYTGTSSVTVQDFNFSVPILCAPTGGPEGSNCNANTTVDTLLPGAVLEGKRSILSVADIALRDVGPDGQLPFVDCPLSCGSGDEQRFLTAGLFAP